MSHESTGQQTTFGYLSIVESAEHGYFGGYLIVSPLGRPLEFHCTAPVRPSRAQRILYGATLEPYLLGEQLAGALLKAAKVLPGLILTNCETILQARSRTSAPMVFVNQGAKHQSEVLPTDTSSTLLDDSSVPCRRILQGGASKRTFTLGSNDFELPVGYESEQDTVIALLNELDARVDLVEPFARIEEAIREAQRLGGSPGETHDQAA